MWDELFNLGQTRLYVRPTGSNEPWHELDEAFNNFMTALKKALKTIKPYPIRFDLLAHFDPGGRGTKRRRYIRMMQDFGALKKPKTTYRTNKEYFKKKRKHR